MDEATKAAIDCAFQDAAVDARELFGSCDEQHDRLERLIDGLSPTALREHLTGD